MIKLPPQVNTVFLLLDAAGYLERCSAILSLRQKKSETKPMNYLTVDAVKHLLSIFDCTNVRQFRDLCIISLLYESGARVSDVD